MPAYCLFDVHEIRDPDALGAYRAGVRATVERHGGRYLLVGGRAEVIEGTWAPVFPVLIRFPSLAAARRWYDSEEYRALRAIRLGATKGSAVFLESEPNDFVDEGDV